MKRHSVAGLLLTALLATGLLLMGSTAASAHTTKFRPPTFDKARFTCQEGGAVVVTKLRNPNAVVQEYMVGITAGDIHYDYVVTVAAHGVGPVEFGGLPNGKYLLQVQGETGDFIASTGVHVQCDVKPPTTTPTVSPTGTPTVSPSETPSTSPTTGTSSATTMAPSTPVAVPTAVEAGLRGPAAQDDSSPGWTIVGAGLLAAGGMMIGLVSLVARRRRGLHQL
jgi:hypothetical protein